MKIRDRNNKIRDRLIKELKDMTVEEFFKLDWNSNWVGSNSSYFCK